MITWRDDIRDTLFAIRWALIRKLAGRDPVLLNVEVRGLAVTSSAARPLMVCRGFVHGETRRVP